MKVGDSQLTRIGLGTNRLVNSRGNVEFIKAAVSAGVQMIDTAHSYTGGQSEDTIGIALAPKAPSCVVATKGGIGGAGRGRPEVLRDEIEQSFRRLQTDSIDLYYLHRVDPETPLEESLAAIKDYQDAGRIRQIGISEVTIDQIERARKIVSIAAVQNHYNLTERKYESVVDYCGREGITFVPFFPLRSQHSTALVEMAKRHKATPSQITLAWLLRRSPLMFPIPGTLSLEHLKENLAASDIELGDADYGSLL